MKRIANCSLCCLLAVVATSLSYAQDTPVDRKPKAPAGEPAEGDKTPAPPKPTSVEGLKPVTTESGLKYWDIKVGKGEKPPPDAVVTFRYAGWLSDGTVIADPAQKDKPSRARFDHLVPGLAEGIFSMRVGGKRQMLIPPELGYGERGGRNIPGNATLLFEVELISVKGPPKPTSVEGLTPVTTKSGLKYYDFKVGDGLQPVPGAKVKVRYSVWDVGGKLLRTSWWQPEPALLPLDLYKGWSEGVGSMKVGGRRRIEVPPELGPDEQSRDGALSNTALIVEVDLLDVAFPPHLAPLAGSGPVTTASGLKYYDIKVGDGPTPPGPTSKVTLWYMGWLTDGRVFDSADRRGGQVTMRVYLLLEGLQEGISSMKVGGVRWMEIPPELGFREFGHEATNVGPDETLFFKVELLGVGPPRHLEAIDGVKPMISASGLKYHDIKKGDGQSPRPESTVEFKYTGWLADGTAFVSTEADGKPFTIRLDQVIEGLQEGIGSMKVGGVRWMEIPPELGFGDDGYPPNNVGPGETLIFEVELLKVKKE